jgi:hypothetical protein
MIINKQTTTPRIEIGLPWTMNPEYYDIQENTLSARINNDNYFTNYRYMNKIFANLHPVDIVPIVPKLDFSEAKKFIESQSNNILEKLKEQLAEVIMTTLLTKFKPDYKTGRRVFNYYLKEAFKIIDKNEPDIHYVRVYATDNTQIAESITSNYEIIEIGKFINEKLNSGAESILSKIFGNTGLLIFKGLSNVYEMTYHFNEEAIKGNVSLKELVSLLLESNQLKIDFPKRWVNTEYNRTFNLSIELSSPYGHPKAVYKWVIQPLLTLLLLAAPANMYGMIGMPLYVRIKAHGLFDIPLGAIQSIIFDRGGSNTKYNIYKQPLKINVTLSIIDLYNYFSLDAYTSSLHFDTTKELNEISDINNYSPEDNKNISYQPTMSNLAKSFKPVKDSNYESKSSYIRSYKIRYKKFSGGFRNNFA